MRGLTQAQLSVIIKYDNDNGGLKYDKSYLLQKKKRMENELSFLSIMYNFYM